MRCILLPLQILASVWPTHTIVDTCDVCGRHPLVPGHGRSEQVVGGADAQAGAWPWVVSLQLPTITGHKHSCGGSLVSGRWILTAAHCFLNKRDLPHWRAVIGAWKLSSLGSEVHVRYIKRIVIHEDYQRTTETSDIALMELDQPVKCSNYIQPACLPDMTVTISLLNHCYISGWGILGKTAAREVSDTMHEVRVNRFSVAQCNSSSWYNGAIEEHTLCAGYEEGGADICQGDSGGPLMCQEGGSQPFWIIGITSWGQGCGKAHKPGVYTDTQHFYPWIKQLAGPMPQPPPTPMPMPTIKVPVQSESTPNPTSSPISSPSTPEATKTPAGPPTLLQTTSPKKPLVFFWPPTTSQPLPQPKAQPMSQTTSGVLSKPTTQLHAESPNTLEIEVVFQPARAPSSPHAKPSSSSPTHTTSHVPSPSSSPHAKVLPESTAHPNTIPLLEIEIVSEPVSKSPPQPPSPSKAKVTSLLASIIQSALQTSPQPPSPTSPKSEISSQTTSQVLSPSSSPHAKILPESTAHPNTIPLLEIDIVSEPVSKSPPQPPSPSKAKVTSLLASIIQSALQTSPQPSSPSSPKTEIPSQTTSQVLSPSQTTSQILSPSHTTSQVLSPSSSPHAKVLPESTAQPNTIPLLEIDIVSEPVSKSPPQPPSPSKEKVTSLLASIIQSALQTSPQPSSPSSPKTEIPSQTTSQVLSPSHTTSQVLSPSHTTFQVLSPSHTTSQVLSPSSSPHAKVLPESTAQPNTIPLLEIEIVSEPVSKSPPQPPSPLKTEGTSPLASITQSALQTSYEHKTQSLPKPEVPTEVGSTSQTESQSSPETKPEHEAPQQSTTTPQPTSITPPQPSPQTEPEREAATQPVIINQSTSEAPTRSETTSEPESETTAHVVIIPHSTSEAPTQSETQSSEPESETPAQVVIVFHTTEAPTQSETQSSHQTTSEPESETPAQVVIVFHTTEAPTQSKPQISLQTEPKTEPEVLLESTTPHLPPATSPPTSQSSPETMPQPKISSQPHFPQTPSQLKKGQEVLPLIEISHTDSTVFRFLRVIQKFLHIIKKEKNAMWFWPNLSNLKLIKDADLASVEEELESLAEDDESW